MHDSRTTHRSVIAQIGSSEINKKNYNWIELNETIFHPKGGGQPADAGTINGMRVVHVHKNIPDKNQPLQFSIYHCFDTEQPFNFIVGMPVELEIDATIRMHNSRLHTAGHVLAEAVNEHFTELVAYQGNHGPGDSYVKFKMVGNPAAEKEEIKQRSQEKINLWIDQNHEISYLFESEGKRSVKVVKAWVPCGGTHVKNLKEISGLAILDLSVNKKDGTITIKYTINSEE